MIALNTRYTRTLITAFNFAVGVILEVTWNIGLSLILVQSIEHGGSIASIGANIWRCCSRAWSCAARAVTGLIEIACLLCSIWWVRGATPLLSLEIFQYLGLLWLCVGDEDDAPRWLDTTFSKVIFPSAMSSANIPS